VTPMATSGSPCGAGFRCAQTPELLDSQKAGAHGGTPALRGRCLVEL
jgi:hypothetical protein